jgi:hypothetical protein
MRHGLCGNTAGEDKKPRLFETSLCIDESTGMLHLSAFLLDTQMHLSNDEILVMHHADTEMTDYDTYNRRFQSPQGVWFASYRGLQTLVGSVLLLLSDTHIFILSLQSIFRRPITTCTGRDCSGRLVYDGPYGPHISLQR